MKLAACLLIGACIWLPLPAQAIMTIGWTDYNVDAALGWNGFHWIEHGQTFTLSDPWPLLTADFRMSTAVDEPELYIATLRDGNNLSIELASVTGFTDSTIYAGWKSFNFDSIPLQPGNYAITVARENVFPASLDGFSYDTSGAAPGHHIMWDGYSWQGGGLSDSAFQFTFGTVPEPLSSGLIAAGGLLLLTCKRKFKPITMP